MSVDVKKEEVFEIRTFQDLVSALRMRPEWREELRRLILSDELLELPQKFEAFVEQDFRPLKRDVDTLKQDVAVLKQDVAVLKQDVASLKGRDLERHVREYAPAYFGRHLVGLRDFSARELAQMLEQAEAQGRITEEERLDVLSTDLVAKGRLKATGEERVMVAEISQVVDKHDVERAVRRARVMEKVMGLPAVPVVVGNRTTQGARQAIEEGGVLYIMTRE